jgi:hypothetical protein
MTSRKKISFGRTNRYCVTDKQRFSKPPPTGAIFTDEISLPEADMLRTIVCTTFA